MKHHRSKSKIPLRFDKANRRGSEARSPLNDPPRHLSQRFNFLLMLILLSNEEHVANVTRDSHHRMEVNEILFRKFLNGRYTSELRTTLLILVVD